MKKLFSTIFLAITLLCACSCVGLTDTQNQGTGNANASNSTGSNNVNSGSSTISNLGDYNVIIESCRLANAYTGEPIVIVKYKFTNNDSDPASFSWSVDDNVYQDGIGLNECYFVANSANYSSDNQTKEIKQGVSIYVEVAYELNDTTTDIEVEVSKLISFDDKKIQKTFSIK